jgi:hypothetical protein
MYNIGPRCAIADFKDVFRDLVSTDVVVSLVLRANDDREDRCRFY